MENHSATYDLMFRALADPTRRAIISRLAQGPASVTELAASAEMGLPAFLKHLAVLEDSALIRSTKAGRVRTCHIQPDRFSTIENWLAEQRALWAARTDRLAHYVENEMPQENSDER